MPQDTPGRRGMRAARRIDVTSLLTTQARKHAKQARDTPEQAVTRRQLKKLRAVLIATQEAAIRDGLSSRALAHLDRQLTPIDAALSVFLKSQPRSEALSVLTEAARYCRRELKGGLD